jgi:gp16 family phage-associated protein
MKPAICVGVGPLGYVADGLPGGPGQQPGTTDVQQDAAAQRKQQFIDRGESIGTWADKHGFRRPDVYRVLNGQSPALRGNQHQIAVKLGIKPDPSKTTA